MLLLTAVVAVWVAYFCLDRQISRLEQEIAWMQPWAGELVVEDTEQIAVAMLPQMWIDETRWEIHLPEGEYVMRLATREIGDQGVAPVVEETVVNSGEHRIGLLQSDERKCRKITVMVDDRPLIETTVASDWDPRRGYVGGGNFAICTQLPAHEPVVLYRRRFVPKSGPLTSNVLANGLLVWIERIEPTDTAGEDL